LRATVFEKIDGLCVLAHYLVFKEPTAETPLAPRPTIVLEVRPTAQDPPGRSRRLSVAARL